MLWLCLYLPRWSLQVAGRGMPPAIPLVLLEQARVRQVNPAAAQAGIRPGMRVATAHALAVGLKTIQRNPAAELEALQRLAGWAYRYTDQVLLSDQALLLEVAGSIKLWGPLPRLMTRLDDGLEGLGYQAKIGLAPSPAAAGLFAPQRLIAVETRHMQQCLLPLSVARLPISRDDRQSLSRSGIQQLKELLDLPRAGLQKRFGSGLCDYLDQLLGEAPCPLPRYQPARQFHADLPLPAPLDASEGLLFVGRRLLEELSGYLDGQDAATARLEWLLEHEDQPPSKFAIGLASPDRAAERWLMVLREHLNRWRLPAPVVRIRLRADELVHYQPRQRDFLNGVPAEETRHSVLERLSARLGSDAVSQVSPLADHRPEKAWRYAPPADHKPAAHCCQRRPLWLLTRPRPVDPAELTFISRAERIETGWWDDQGCTRDYFVADGPDGRRLWVFNQHKPASGWHVQGYFD